MDMTDFEQRGWVISPPERPLLAWALAAHRAGVDILHDPDMRTRWLDCYDTWFVGVDVLPNAPDGSLGDVPLAGAAIDAIGPLPALHKGQVSIVFPGYPKPRRGESLAAFGYRETRCAAHVDGITAEGPDRRRFVTEPHGFVLGLPLTEVSPGAAPLTVWEGSHRIVGAALAEALDGVQHPGRRDVTDVYQAARKACFECCDRVELHARPGQAILLHRHLLHGIGAWERGSLAPVEGRMIAYFRPLARGGIAAWASHDSLV